MTVKDLRFGAMVGLSVLGLVAVAWAGPPQQITIEKCGDKRAAVSFDHALHVAAESDCTSCHHTDENLTAESGTATSCRSCHLEPEEGVLGCSEMSLSRNVYHKQCIDCHKSATATDPSIEAPTKCADCHSSGSS